MKTFLHLIEMRKLRSNLLSEIFTRLWAFRKTFVSLRLMQTHLRWFAILHRKEVIQPHLPIRLPCYDFTPVTNPAVVIALLAVRLTTSGRTRSHGVTGGVYKTRERIHRGMLIRDY